MKNVSFGGQHIAYYPSGQPENVPVVLLHGFCSDSSMWTDWIPLLPPRYFVCIDLPGFGQSGLTDGLSIEQMADAVIAVLDQLGAEKCVLAGHSMGGYTGAAMAEKYPHRLAGLCMFHSHPFPDPDDKKANRLKSMEFIQRHGHELYVKQLIPSLFSPDFAKNRKEKVDELVHKANACEPASIIASLEAMRSRPDRSEGLRRLACPVQFIIGELDAAIPLDMSLAQTHLPSVADIVLLPKVGHMGMFETPYETAGAFRDFLANLEQAGI